MHATLSLRVADLEWQNRALRTSLALTLLGVVTCGSGGITSSFERVNTNVLVIRAADERPRITLDQRGTSTFHRPEGDVVLDGDAVASLRAAGPPCRIVAATACSRIAGERVDVSRVEDRPRRIGALVSVLEEVFDRLRRQDALDPAVELVRRACR